MLQLKRLLVPRDGSQCADHALDEGLGLALRSGAQVHVLRVDVLHGDASVSVHDIEGERERLRERLRRLARAENLHDPERIVIEYHVERDVAVAPSVLAYANEQDVDLIVMGTHGRRGLQRLLLGSVAEEVVRLSSCPVMTVHAKKLAKTYIAGRPLDAILVPYDFSQYAARALEHACEWASLYDARIELLHVVEEYLHPAFYNTGVFSIYDIQPDIEDRALKQLAAAYKKTGCARTDVSFRAVPGRAPAEIASYAGKINADLIVMSTHGLTGVEHFLLGSVAEKVVRMAPCPVLTVKAFGRSLISEEMAGAAERAL